MAYNLTQLWNQENRLKLYPTVYIQCVILVLGFIGNIVVLGVYSFRMKENRDDRYFIPVLSVFDLIASTSASVFFVLESIYFVVFPFESLCIGLFFCDDWFLVYIRATTTSDCSSEIPENM